ncbi:MAG: hypothetical protein HY814_05105 [Candidatus Riflebacteria bacterium]|nr:hypothetical protein [Candidatus Riflebacteria bacterium]
MSDTWEWDGSNWSQRLPATSPGRMTRHSMVYDSQRCRTVLYGGQNSAWGGLGNTWEYDGTSWSEKSASTTPGLRKHQAMAYDRMRGRVVLFGGENASDVLGETWEYDGTSWAKKTTTTSPQARSAARLVFDSTRGRMVLFGGVDSQHATWLTDTWEFDGISWLQTAAAQSPPGVTGAEMAFDEARQRVVLFGGDQNGSATGDARTWEYDGTGWKVVAYSTPNGPSAWKGAALAYDSARARVVAFSGVTHVWPSWPNTNETWEFDGVSWSQRQPATRPPIGPQYSMCFDAARSRSVMLRETAPAETWDWDGMSWSRPSPVTSPPFRENTVLVWEASRALAGIWRQAVSHLDAPR